ncbi:AAA family ATPase [Salibacter halophilus]
MCYYGMNNFEFASGLNVILGENGEGKTKFFEALVWLFRGHDHSLEIVVSAKKLAEVEVGDDFPVSVSLVVEQYGEVRYLKRSFIARKEEGGDCSVDNHSFEGIEENRSGERSKVDADRLLQQVFPSEIRKYSMFKGESELNIFDNEDALVNLINLFAEAKHYDKYATSGASLTQAADKAVAEASKKSTENKKKYDRLEHEIAHLKREKGRQETLLETAQEDLGKLEANLQKAEKFVNNAEALEIINEKIENIKKEIRDEYGVIRENYTTYLFDENWLLCHYEPIFIEFEKKVTALNKKRRELQSEFDKEKGRQEGEKNAALKLLGDEKLPLPNDIPNKNIMQELIADEHCKVCNRPAPKGSEAYNYMVERLQAYLDSQVPKEKEQEEALYENDYTSELVNMLNLHNNKLTDIRNIGNEITELFEFNSARKSKVQELQSHLEEAHEERIKILGSSTKGEEKLGNVLKNYNGWQSDKVRSRKTIVAYESELDRIAKELEEKGKEKDRIDLESANSFLVKTRAIIRDIEKIFKDTKEEKFNLFISHLEEQSNSFFEEINKGAFTGKIRFTKRKLSENRVKIDVDLYEGERRFYEPNQSLLTSMYISILFAISELAKQSREEAYPLIFDAPTSSFGETKTKEFLNIISNSENQIILLLKDFLSTDATSDTIKIDNEFNKVQRSKAFWVRLKRPFDPNDLTTINTEVITV